MTGHWIKNVNVDTCHPKQSPNIPKITFAGNPNIELEFLDPDCQKTMLLRSVFRTSKYGFGISVYRMRREAYKDMIYTYHIIRGGDWGPGGLSLRRRDGRGELERSSQIARLIYAFLAPSQNKQINKMPVLRTPLLPVMYLSRKHFRQRKFSFPAFPSHSSLSIHSSLLPELPHLFDL